MALTIELIKANSSLSALSEEQINAIVTLSTNDESSVLGTRIGEIYRQMDATIASVTGVERNGDEKTYKYLERATKALAEKAKSADGLTTQIATLTKEKQRLEKVIAEGQGDKEAAKALAQTKKDLAAVTKQFNDLKAEYDKAKTDHEAELFGIRVDNALSVATSGVKFKAELPASVTKVIMEQACAKVKGMNPEYIDDGKGGKILAFKDATGAIMRNPDNMLNPYTATELINKELKEMGVLADGQPAAGGGTKPIVTTGGNGEHSVNVSGAKTRLEANELITNALLAQGLTIGSEEFDNAVQTAWKDNNVASLPEK